MQSHSLKNKKNKPHFPVKNQEQSVQFKDNRSENTAQLKAQQIANSTVQRKENKAGMPDNLKSGIENLSGVDMSDVKVHYNSPQPTQLQAHAFAQGNQIHIASGQERHLPHEAWHVVQQKQGRVAPTKQLKGKVNINDDTGLEKEADVMGEKALQMKKEALSTKQKGQTIKKNSIQSKKNRSSLTKVGVGKNNQALQLKGYATDAHGWRIAPVENEWLEKILYETVAVPRPIQQTSNTWKEIKEVGEYIKGKINAKISISEKEDNLTTIDKKYIESVVTASTRIVGTNDWDSVTVAKSIVAHLKEEQGHHIEDDLDNKKVALTNKQDKSDVEKLGSTRLTSIQTKIHDYDMERPKLTVPNRLKKLRAIESKLANFITDRGEKDNKNISTHANDKTKMAIMLQRKVNDEIKKYDGSGSQLNLDEVERRLDQVFKDIQHETGLFLTHFSDLAMNKPGTAKPEVIAAKGQEKKIAMINAISALKGFVNKLNANNALAKAELKLTTDATKQIKEISADVGEISGMKIWAFTMKTYINILLLGLIHQEFTVEKAQIDINRLSNKIDNIKENIYIPFTELLADIQGTFATQEVSGSLTISPPASTGPTLFESIKSKISSWF